MKKYSLILLFLGFISCAINSPEIGFNVEGADATTESYSVPLVDELGSDMDKVPEKEEEKTPTVGLWETTDEHAFINAADLIGYALYHETYGANWITNHIDNKVIVGLGNRSKPSSTSAVPSLSARAYFYVNVISTLKFAQYEGDVISTPMVETRYTKLVRKDSKGGDIWFNHRKLYDNFDVVIYTGEKKIHIIRDVKNYNANSVPMPRDDNPLWELSSEKRFLNASEVLRFSIYHENFGIGWITNQIDEMAIFTTMQKDGGFTRFASQTDRPELSPKALEYLKSRSAQFGNKSASNSECGEIFSIPLEGMEYTKLVRKDAQGGDIWLNEKLIYLNLDIIVYMGEKKVHYVDTVRSGYDPTTIPEPEPLVDPWEVTGTTKYLTPRDVIGFQFYDEMTKGAGYIQGTSSGIYTTYKAQVSVDAPQNIRWFDFSASKYQPEHKYKLLVRKDSKGGDIWINDTYYKPQYNIIVYMGEKKVHYIHSLNRYNVADIPAPSFEFTQDEWGITGEQKRILPQEVAGYEVYHVDYGMGKVVGANGYFAIKVSFNQGAPIDLTYTSCDARTFKDKLARKDSKGGDIWVHINSHNSYFSVITYSGEKRIHYVRDLYDYEADVYPRYVENPGHVVTSQTDITRDWTSVTAKPFDVRALRGYTLDDIDEGPVHPRPVRHLKYHEGAPTQLVDSDGVPFGNQPDTLHLLRRKDMYGGDIWTGQNNSGDWVIYYTGMKRIVKTEWQDYDYTEGFQHPAFSLDHDIKLNVTSSWPTNRKMSYWREVLSQRVWRWTWIGRAFYSNGSWIHIHGTNEGIGVVHIHPTEHKLSIQIEGQFRRLKSAEMWVHPQRFNVYDDRPPYIRSIGDDAIFDTHDIRQRRIPGWI